MAGEIDLSVITSLIPGPWGVLAGLLFKYGPDLVDKLIQNSKNNVPVTADEWQSIRNLINTPFDKLAPPK
jgi:hypothetical protein